MFSYTHHSVVSGRLLELQDRAAPASDRCPMLHGCLRQAAVVAAATGPHEEQKFHVIIVVIGRIFDTCGPRDDGCIALSRGWFLISGFWHVWSKN